MSPHIGSEMSTLCYDTQVGTSSWCVLGRLRSRDVVNCTAVNRTSLPCDLPHDKCGRWLSDATVLYDAKGLPTGNLFAKESGKQLMFISYNCTEDVYISADY